MTTVRNANKIKTTIFVSIALILSFFLGVFSPINITNKQSDEVKLFDEIYTLLSDNWYYAEDEDMLNRAVSALISDDVDMFTYLQGISSEPSISVGLGITVTDYGGYLYVTSVMYDSPADKAGLQEGDIITSLAKDGSTTNFDGMTYTNVMECFDFYYGQLVTLGVKRNGVDLSVDVTISTLGEDKTVYSDYENSKYFKIKITKFDLFTASEFQNELTNHYNNAKNLIIDLRENPGGYVNTVEEIADVLLPKGTTIMGYKYRNGSTEYHKAKSNASYHFDNIYIMINENSASGAEALTAALKENATVMNSNVYVVGQNSYGKGSAQKDYTLSTGQKIHVTFALWMSPAGNNIHKVGIAPTEGYTIEKPAYDASLFTYTSTLKLNDYNTTVLALQNALKILGQDVYLSGYYDDNTVEAVKAIQTLNSLEVTGEVNLQTYNYIRRAIIDQKAEFADNELAQVISWIGA